MFDYPQKPATGAVRPCLLKQFLVQTLMVLPSYNANLANYVNQADDSP